jgi:sulfonate transport system substrate-binding protein
MNSPDLSRRKLLGLAAAGVAGLALGACGDNEDDPAAAPATTATTETAAVKDFGGLEITTAVYAKNHGSAPLYWQQFAPPGLKVRPVIVTSPADISRSLVAGTLDFGLMGYYNTIIEAATTGMTSKMICMCSENGSGIVARKDRGIASVADLKGKKIGVPPPGVQVMMLTALLEKSGLKLGTDVQTVPLAFADHKAALERGDIDAYAGTEPIPSQSVVDGTGVRITGLYDTPAGNFNTAMWAAPKHLNNPELLSAVVKMQRDSAELLTPGGKNSETEWRKLLVDQFGFTEGVYKEVLNNVGAVWRFDDARRKQYEGAAELMLTQGVITKKPNIDDLLLLDFQPKS